MRYAGLFAMVAVLGLVALPTMADPITDTFWADGSLSGFWRGGGSGYDADLDGEGDWYYYPNYDWQNQWFYDGEYVPAPAYKNVHVEFDADVWDDEENARLEVVINWSTPEWSALGLDRPPLPGDCPDAATEDLYIERSSEPEWGSFWVRPYTYLNGPEHISVDFVIPSYNPEWVSIDIDGYNYDISNGVIIHDCVPEPGSVSLLALGGLALLRRRR